MLTCLDLTIYVNPDFIPTKAKTRITKLPDQPYAPWAPYFKIHLFQAHTD